MRFTISSIDPTLILDEYGNEAFRYLGIHPQDVERLLATPVHLQDKIDDLSEKVEQLQEEIEDLESNKEDLETENRRLRLALDDSFIEKESLEEEFQILEDKLHGAEYDNWQLEEKLNAEITRLEAEIDNLRAQLIAK